MRLLLGVLCFFILSGCSSRDDLPPTVDEFLVQRYMGKWHEKARYDHSFERGLDRVTATYTLREDGKVSVLNRGYNTKKDKWKEATGHAYVKDTGLLRVSFFWPFYGDYRILYLDKNYSTAIVGGSSKDYIWILTRDPKIDIKPLVKRLDAMGYDTAKLIYVNH